MIRSFADEETELLFATERSRRLPPQMQRRAVVKLNHLDHAEVLDDVSGLQNRSGTWMCRRDEHVSACRDKGGAALPRPFVCKPRQDARFCKLIT